VKIGFDIRSLVQVHQKVIGGVTVTFVCCGKVQYASPASIHPFAKNALSIKFFHLLPNSMDLKKTSYLNLCLFSRGLCCSAATEDLETESSQGLQLLGLALAIVGTVFMTGSVGDLKKKKKLSRMMVPQNKKITINSG
jgi:hypothetical protein